MTKPNINSRTAKMSFRLPHKLVEHIRDYDNGSKWVVDTLLKQMNVEDGKTCSNDDLAFIIASLQHDG